MSTPTATYAVQLDDKVSGPADSAATALAELKAKIEGDVRALRTMQQAMRNLQGGTSVNVEQFKKLRDQIDAQKASIAAAQSQYLSLGGTFRQTAKQAEQLGDRGMGRLLGASKKLPGPLGRVADGVEDLGDLVKGGGAIAAGLVVIAAAAAILVVGLIAGAAALARYALAQADARRSELLRLEGLASLEQRQGLATASATQLQAAIDRASGAASTSRADVERYAGQLHRAGLRGNALTEALEGVAIVSAVQGDESAKAFARQAAGAARAGRSVRALADDVRTRLGGIARRQLLSLDVQGRKLQENLSRLFGDLPIEGFLEALNEVTSLFSQSTATGRALKTIVEALLGPLLEDVGTLGPIAKRFFQGLVIGALQLTIGFLRVRRWFRDTFGEDFFGRIDGATLALEAGTLVVALLAGAAITLAAALAVVAISAFLVVLPFLLVAAAIALVIYGVVKLYEWLSELDWSEAGSSLISGLVRGLEAGRDLVVETVRGIASAATDALTSALGIASPSRVFAELGRQIPRGLAVGIEAEASTAGSAVEDLGQPAGAAGAARGAMTVSFGDIIIHGAGGDARAIAEELVDEIATALDGIGIELGAPAT